MAKDENKARELLNQSKKSHYNDLKENISAKQKKVIEYLISNKKVKPR